MAEKLFSSKQENNDDEVDATTIIKYYESKVTKKTKQLTSTKLKKCKVEQENQYQARYRSSHLVLEQAT